MKESYKPILNIVSRLILTGSIITGCAVPDQISTSGKGTVEAKLHQLPWSGVITGLRNDRICHMISKAQSYCNQPEEWYFDLENCEIVDDQEVCQTRRVLVT